MAVGAQQLPFDLAALTEHQIEVGLEAGVWSDPAIRPLVQRYLEQMKLSRLEASAAEQQDAARVSLKVAQEAAEEARNANLRASAALIVAGGAMLAAVASAFIAFLAFRDVTISW